MLKIVSIEPLKDLWIKQIKDATSFDTVVIEKDKVSLYDFSKTDVLIARDRDISEEIINKCSSLKLLFIVSAGVEKLPFQKLKEKNIMVANSGDLSAEAMAEHTLGVMLMFSAKLLNSVLNQKNKFWEKYVINDTLVGKRLLVVGAGKIGQRIAQKAKVFNMETVGIRSIAKETLFFDEVLSMNEIDEQLGMADYVVCILPLTEETDELFDCSKFSIMKKEAVFINISRGKLVNENDLWLALKDKQISGAALDVFYPEPLSYESPLWDMENLIITPHSSGRIENFVEKTISVFIDNIKAYMENIELPTKINLDKKY